MIARQFFAPLSLLALLLTVNFSHGLEYNDVQIHGFASQAYLLSDGNNFYGDSQRGSTEFYELGVNASWQATNTLNIAGQLLSRDAGATDNGSVEIDYLFADLKVVENDLSGLGFRIGRVRNAYGFYNETRDVLVTRPSILLPQAIYFEGNGLRELLFSSDGVQLYSYWDDDDDSISLSLTLGRNKSVSADVIKNILGSSTSQFIVQGNLRHPVFAQLAHSVNGGSTRLALSMFDVDMAFSTNIPGSSDFNLYSTGYVASLQHNLQRWSFTGEYSLTDVAFQASQSYETQIEAAYVQAQFRLSTTLKLHSRIEYSTYDRDNRNESDNSHLILGVKWTPTTNWTIAADIYGIRGSAGVPAIDNPAGLNERTELLAVMIGYRF